MATKRMSEIWLPQEVLLRQHVGLNLDTDAEPFWVQYVVVL